MIRRRRPSENEKQQRGNAFSNAVAVHSKMHICDVSIKQCRTAQHVRECASFGVKRFQIVSMDELCCATAAPTRDGCGAAT